MKTPRLALTAALFALAPSARAAAPTSLAGWTAFQASEVANPAIPTSGKPYLDGVVYCDMRDSSPAMARIRIGRNYNCVVIGGAPHEGAKIGGQFAEGQATYQVGTGPAWVGPGGRSEFLMMKLREAPYIPRTLMLTIAIPAAQAPYTSYVVGGNHLNAAGAAAASGSMPDTRIWWCNPSTGQKEGRPFSSPARTGWIMLESQAVACRKSPAAGPVVQASAPPANDPLIWWCNPSSGAKFSRPLSRPGRTGWIMLESQAGVCAKSDAAGTGPDAPGKTKGVLLPGEIRWLTKVQAAAYEAELKAAPNPHAGTVVVDKYGSLVKAQLRPEDLPRYTAAFPDSPELADDEKMSAAIDGFEMWGGKDVSAIVGPFQETADPAKAKLLEIQLSKAEWDVLSKTPPAKPEHAAAFEAYKKARDGTDGKSAGGGFSASSFDPIALRLATVAARKALGPVAGIPAGALAGAAAGAEPVLGLLTEEELKLLTPTERAQYNSLLAAAKRGGKVDESDANLRNTTKGLRKKISEKDRLSVPPLTGEANDAMTAKQFAALPDFQKRQFCANYPVDVQVLAADKAGKELDNSADAFKGLGNSGGKSGAGPGGAAAKKADTKWSTKDRRNACNKLPPEAALTIDGTEGLPSSLGADVPRPDTEPDAKKKDSAWLNKGLVQTGLRGGLTGLIIGSLFGPLGLLLGPMIGAAVYYAMSKRDADKAKAEDK